MVKQMTSVTKKELRWTPRLVKQLRGKRSLADFAAMIGASKKSVRRWEVGQAQPDATYAERLSDLAVRENFLKDWKLVGSMTLVGDLESAKAEISELFRKSGERSEDSAKF
jgi:predicted transcriptional regulator